MGTLAEIEAAVRNLPPEQQRELLLFLTRCLRQSGAEMPEPRLFSEDELQAWMDEDERDLRELRAGR